MKQKGKLFIYLALAIAMSSCRWADETPTANTSSIDQGKASISQPKVENGRLEFNNWESVFDYLSSANALSPEALSVQEQELGFSSLKSLYNEFEEISESSRETGYGMSLEELAAKYKHALLFDSEGDFELDTWSVYYAPALNHHGELNVGDKVHILSKSKWIEAPEAYATEAYATEANIARLRIMNQADPEIGTKVFIKDNDIQANRLRCETFVNTPGTFSTLFANSWLFQDATRPGGAHEWKIEIEQ